MSNEWGTARTTTLIMNTTYPEVIEPTIDGAGFAFFRWRLIGAQNERHPGEGWRSWDCAAQWRYLQRARA